jgi:cell wall-associated NlpC family hydrolase
MHKFFKNILYVFVFSLMATSLGSFTETSAKETCTVSGAQFTKIQGDGDQFGEKVKTTLKIQSKGCHQGGLTVQIIGISEIGTQEVLRIDNAPGGDKYKPESLTGNLWIEFNADESEPYACNNTLKDTWGYECINFVKIFDAVTGSLLYQPNSLLLNAAYIKKPSTTVVTLNNQGILVADCDGECDNGDQNQNDVDNWEVLRIINGAGLLSGECTLSNDGAQPDVYFTGLRGASFTDQMAKLNIRTKDKCDGLAFAVSLYHYKLGNRDPMIGMSNTENNTVNVIAPVGKNLEVNFRVNEDSCFSAAETWDCAVYVKIEVDGGNFSFETKKFFEDPPGGIKLDNFNNNINLKKGVLAYECKTAGDCRNNEFGVSNGSVNDWRYESSNAVLANEQGKPQTTPPIEPTFDTTSVCYSTNANNTGEPGYSRDCYELLAPIPGLQSVNNPDNIVTTSDGRVFIKNLSEFQISDYINSIFQIALGILMVLSVVMIVIAGVQYMTEESIYGKSNARDRITGAVTGLILSLGIFVILDTINPRLLEINFGENIDEVETRSEPGVALTSSQQSFSASQDINNSPPGTYLKAAGIYCPTSGGQGEIQKIATSFENRVTYRLGGKYHNLGKSLPTEYLAPDNNNSCPIQSRTLCLDCSGFVNLVLRCSGAIKNNIGDGSTGGFFDLSASKAINKSTTNLRKNTVNGEEIEIGDMVGSSKNHVAIYVGNGYFIDSNGGGRGLNTMTKKFRLTEKHIDRWASKILKFKDIPAQFK